MVSISLFSMLYCLSLAISCSAVPQLAGVGIRQKLFQTTSRRILIAHPRHRSFALFFHRAFSFGDLRLEPLHFVVGWRIECLELS